MKRITNNEKGQSLVEYAFIIAFCILLLTPPTIFLVNAVEALYAAHAAKVEETP